MKAELAVVCDQLRTMGLEDVARWVEHPGAVRELLLSGQYAFDPMEAVCSSCAQFHDLAHLQGCANAAAWRALGDPRGAADIERAHEEALRQDTQLEPSLFGVNSDVSGYELWRSENLPQENLTMGSILQAMDPVRFR